MMYEAFSADYDRFIDWPARLAAELPFIEGQLQAAGAQRVLDAACGTGMHAIALAERGYEVVGTDVSSGMIERARANAAAAGVDARFEVAGFTELSTQVGGDFDALLCLGNSLPHLLAPAELHAALVDFAACLRPGGLLLVQNRNFDRILALRERWMDPQSHREGDREWLFLRFYDFEGGELLRFNLVTLRREGGGVWEQHVSNTRLRGLVRDEAERLVQNAGFEAVTVWGDMQGAPFDPAHSPNLVFAALRP